MKKILYFVLFSTFVFAVASCGGKKEEGNPEVDSLRNVLNGNMQAMNEMDLFLDAVNTSMDSIVNMDGTILRTTGESPKLQKQQILANIEAYKQILKNQRERLAILEEKLKKSGNNSAKMLKTIEALKQQIEEKDQAIVELTAELNKRNFDIQTLKTHVAELDNYAAELSETNKAQEEALEAQSNLMNEAYYLIGSKKELKAAGVLTSGSLFKKSKLDLQNVNTSAFKKIDIRNTKTFKIPGKNPELLTQAPSGSYTITANSDGTCTLTVTNPTEFWSISNYLIIKY